MTGLGVPDTDGAQGQPAGSFRSLVVLLEGLHGVAPGAVESTASLGASRQALKRALVRALLEPALSTTRFLACAAALKLVACADENASPISLAERAQQLILGTLERPAPKDARVIAALDMVDMAAACGKRLRLKDAAKVQGVESSHLSRLIAAETGYYLTDWRTACLLRSSLPALVDTNEHVKQIACRLLRFSDETQFTREFHRMFGLCPTDFRRAW